MNYKTLYQVSLITGLKNHEQKDSKHIQNCGFSKWRVWRTRLAAWWALHVARPTAIFSLFHSKRIPLLLGTVTCPAKKLHSLASFTDING